jgi:hypothetical protein
MRSTIMAHDGPRRDSTDPDRPEPNRPDDPSAVSEADVRQFDREQLRQRILWTWKEAIDAEIALFRAATLLEQLEGQDDAVRAAEADQLAAGLRDDHRQLRRRLRRLRDRLEAGRPGRPWGP